MRRLIVDIEHWESEADIIMSLNGFKMFFCANRVTHDLHLIGVLRTRGDQANSLKTWTALAAALKEVKKKWFFHALVWYRGNRMMKLNSSSLRRKIKEYGNGYESNLVIHRDLCY
jgi:hypothetical protein